MCNRAGSKLDVAGNRPINMYRSLITQVMLYLQRKITTGCDRSIAFT